MAGREAQSFDVVQAALARWNREVASVRVHGSTGRRPVDVFEQDERPALRPLPVGPFAAAVWKRAKVHPDGHVALRDKLFSVPWRLTGQAVWLRACGRTLEVFHEDRRVAVHERTGRRRTTLEEHLPEDRRELRHRGRAHWEARAERVGPETLALVREVFDADPALSHLRQAQAIVALLERHPCERAEAASRRARRMSDRTYHGVRRTLLFGLDLAWSPAAADAVVPVRAPVQAAVNPSRVADAVRATARMA